jgi:hypothetical protein
MNNETRRNQAMGKSVQGTQTSLEGFIAGPNDGAEIPME